MIRGVTLATACATPVRSDAKRKPVPQFRPGEVVAVRCLPPEVAIVVRQRGHQVIVRNEMCGEWETAATDLRRERGR